MKKTKTKRKTWVQTQSEISQADFDAKAKELIWQLTEGGGSRNIHILDTIRQLEFSYIKTAAYGLAVRDEEWSKK